MDLISEYIFSFVWLFGNPTGRFLAATCLMSMWRFATTSLSITRKPLSTLSNQSKVLWKVKSGEGLASPVVADGSVFLFENRNGNEAMVALAIVDGSEQWATELSPVFEDGQGPRGPRCTPVVQEGEVFAQCSRGTLHCLDAKSGKIRWEIDYAKLGMTFVGEKGRVPGARRHGFTNTPLVVGNMVYALVGGKGHGIVCFNRSNG